ncbi:ATP-binding protein, partial [Herpetosiphon gulosus]|uniref:ATP-binding protein n=1 Tax=Herpetosiphon gulosus TaxID=1973496 RepID=UPI0031EF0C06
MDDLDLHLALEALRTNPAAHVYHERITRGMQAIEQGTLTPFERDALHRLLARFPIPTPSPDPVAALIAAFQDKLPSVDPVALSTAIHALVAGNTSQLDGKSLALTIEQRGQIQIANLAERNVVMGDLNQLDISVHIPIPDARFDHLMQAAFQRQTHERITKAAQQIESDRLLNLRLQGFVGRVAELAAIREHIATMRLTGGYVLIKALAGEGKSSSIAKLIQEAGIAATPHHFIALTTGREYQVGLLRAVVAQLILKHGLTVSYFPEESYPAMKAEFTRILDELSTHGIQETIYLDGLDQLQPEIDGSRDLSFLPPQPPPGMVIVLGSRPDETLKPLEILHRVDYDLPPLSEADALALWRSVQPGVVDSLFHDLYVALKGNALFVHLAANTMRDQSVVDATSLIQKIEQNPSNLFGITLERIKRVPLSKWDTVWKPILALLLVAQEPLRLDVVGDLLEHDHDTIQDAVWVLGGLVSQGIDQRVTLHHLMFRDYLVVSVFNQREVKRWQQQMADWCAKDLEGIWADDRDPIEQARRVYARHHYITHLFLAENWTTLWQVLDAGDYGEHKTRFDPSTRLYALDLNRGRESAINAGQSTEEHIQNLPRLWKYSLLRTSLTSRVDQWPDDLVEVLAMLGRTQEALERIELSSSIEKKIFLWARIINWCNESQKTTIFSRINQIITDNSLLYNSEIINSVFQVILSTNRIEQAIEIALQIDDKINRILSINIVLNKSINLLNCNIFNNLLDEIIILAKSVTQPEIRIDLFCNITKTIILSGNIDNAIFFIEESYKFIHTVENEGKKSSLICDIAENINNISKLINFNENIQNLTQKIIKDIQSFKDYRMRIKIICILGISLILNKNINDINIIIEEYTSIALSINDDWSRAESIRFIAQFAGNEGHINQAISLLEKSIDIAQSIDNIRTRNAIIRSIAYTSILIGNIDYTMSLLESISHEENHLTILCLIAKEAIHSGHIIHANIILENILKINRIINKGTIRSSSISSIIESNISLNNLECALFITEFIDYSEFKINTLIKIIKVSILHDNIDLPINITKNIFDKKIKSDLLKIIINLGMHLLNPIKISETIKLIDIERIRIESLKNLIQYAISISDINYALNIIKYISSEREKADMLKIIAQGTASMGEIDYALDIAQSINIDLIHSETLKIIIKIAISMKNFNNLMVIARSIKVDLIKADVMIIIAHSETILGNIPQAQHILEESITVAQKISIPSQKADMLKKIIQSIAYIEDFDHAASVAQSIDIDWIQAETFKGIVQIALAKGYQDKAVVIAQSISHVNGIETLKMVAKSVVSSQAALLLDQAATIAHSITEGKIRDKTLKGIAEESLSINNIDLAIKIAESINVDWIRTDIFGNIAQAIAKSGNIDQAIAIVYSINYWNRSKVLLDLAEICSVSNKLDYAIMILNDATTIALSTKDDYKRSETLSTIAQAAASMNSLNDALTIAQLIDNPTKRSETLSTIAQAAASMNSLNDALTIAQLIDNPTKRSETLSTI